VEQEQPPTSKSLRKCPLICILECIVVPQRRSRAEVPPVVGSGTGAVARQVVVLSVSRVFRFVPVLGSCRGGRDLRGRPARARHTRAQAPGQDPRGRGDQNRGERAGALRLEALPNASQTELGPFVRDAIAQATASVRTDGWSGYGDLREHGAKHRAVVQGDPTRAAKILPWSHIAFSNLKGWMRGTFRAA